MILKIKVNTLLHDHTYLRLQIWYKLEFGVDPNISQVEDIIRLQKSMWFWRLTLKRRGHTHTFIVWSIFRSSGCINATDSILVSILTFTLSISYNPKSPDLVVDIENEGQIHFCMTFRIYITANIKQTWSLYRFWHFRHLEYRKC